MNKFLQKEASSPDTKVGKAKRPDLKALTKASKHLASHEAWHALPGVVFPTLSHLYAKFPLCFRNVIF